MSYCTTQDISTLFRSLTAAETTRANALIPVVEARIKQEATNVGKDIDDMIENEELDSNVLKSVIVDIVSRTLMTSTNAEPMTQFSQSALGYSASGTFLNPGGGIFIKKSELRILGLQRQRMGMIDFV